MWRGGSSKHYIGNPGSSLSQHEEMVHCRAQAWGAVPVLYQCPTSQNLLTLGASSNTLMGAQVVRFYQGSNMGLIAEIFPLPLTPL